MPTDFSINRGEYWPHDESSAGDDIIGRDAGNTLTEVNTVGVVSSGLPSGWGTARARTFDDASSQYAYRPLASGISPLDVDGSQSFTFIYWINPVNWTGASFMNVFGRGITGTNNRCYYAYKSAANMVWLVSWNGTAFTTLSGTLPGTGGWHMMACIYDQSAGELGYSLDGAAQTRVSYGGSGVIHNPAGVDFYEGDLSSGAGRYIDAAIGPSGFWTEAVSDTWLSDAWNSGDGADLGAGGSEEGCCGKPPSPSPFTPEFP